MNPGDIVGARTIIAADSNGGEAPTYALALTSEKPGCAYVIWRLGDGDPDPYPERFYSSFVSAVEELFTLT